jgi:hypothetical protein
MSNVGTGSGVYKQKTGSDFELKTLIGGTGITVTSNTSDLTIDYDPADLVTGGFSKVFYFTSTGTTGNITVTHNLGKQYPIVQIYDTTTTPQTSIETDITWSSTSAFVATIPGTYVVGQYFFKVVG